MKRKLIGLMLVMMVSATGLTAIAAQGGTTEVVQEHGFCIADEEHVGVTTNYLNARDLPMTQGSEIKAVFALGEEVKVTGIVFCSDADKEQGIPSGWLQIEYDLEGEVVQLYSYGGYIKLDGSDSVFTATAGAQASVKAETVKGLVSVEVPVSAKRPVKEQSEKQPEEKPGEELPGDMKADKNGVYTPDTIDEHIDYFVYLMNHAGDNMENRLLCSLKDLGDYDRADILWILRGAKEDDLEYYVIQFKDHESAEKFVADREGKLGEGECMQFDCSTELPETPKEIEVPETEAPKETEAPETEGLKETETPETGCSHEWESVQNIITSAQGHYETKKVWKENLVTVTEPGTWCLESYWDPGEGVYSMYECLRCDFKTADEGEIAGHSCDYGHNWTITEYEPNGHWAEREYYEEGRTYTVDQGEWGDESVFVIDKEEVTETVTVCTKCGAVQ